VDRSRIRCRYQIGEVSLKLEYALSCALIFNELISNSLKYAFPDKEKGDIMIRMENYHEDNVILEISDNGIGLPEEIDWRKTKSLGLKIVKLLGEGQLGGRIVYSGGERTTFTLIFPKSKDE
jgi:two-component sensor histidine kinase